MPAKDIYHAFAFTPVSPLEFGEKLAFDINQYLPDQETATRQMAVAGLVSAALGGGRSYFDPGYDEKFDDAGNIIYRKRRNPVRSALHSAGLGLGIGALGNLAAQVGNNWARAKSTEHA